MRMTAQDQSRTNGTYHAAAALRDRQRRVRLMIAIGALLSTLGVVNVILINNDMDRIEQAGPQRLALAGGGLMHFVPSILLNLQRANQGPNAVSVILADDPRHSPPFIDDKRALERWLALTGLSLSVLFFGLEARIPTSTAHPKAPTGSDLSRMLILLSLAYGALSIFESG